jgi:hypothetical protein
LSLEKHGQSMRPGAQRESPWNIRESQDERHIDKDMDNKPRCI